MGIIFKCRRRIWLLIGARSKNIHILKYNILQLVLSKVTIYCIGFSDNNNILYLLVGKKQYIIY
jgi:hypothetical protein